MTPSDLQSALPENPIRIDGGAARVTLTGGETAVMDADVLLHFVTIGAVKFQLGGSPREVKAFMPWKPWLKFPPMKSVRAYAAGKKLYRNPWPDDVLECRRSALGGERKPYQFDKHPPKGVQIDAADWELLRHMDVAVVRPTGEPPYANARHDGRTHRLHNLVLGCRAVPKNGDYLDCRRSNLIPAECAPQSGAISTAVGTILIDESDEKAFRWAYMKTFDVIEGRLCVLLQKDWVPLELVFSTWIGHGVLAPAYDDVTETWDFRRAALRRADDGR